MKRQIPSRCTICSHREHVQIDLALARHVSIRALSRRFKVSNDSLYRHQKAHLSPQLRARLIAGPDVEGVDLEHLRNTESQSLLMNLIALRNRLLAGLDVAEEAGDSGMVARVANQLHRNLEITGELLGDLSVGSVTINNVLVLPAYVEMRLELVKALAPFPDARQAVAEVLHRIESKAAEEIGQKAARGLAR